MQHSTKIIFNTIASYLRIIVNGIVSIIVTRIALKALGVDDFGLYNLMAGTIALLSFINSALLISSQRYFSIAIGKKDNLLLQKYFSVSIIIHLLFSGLIIILLIGIQPLLFGYILNINPQQIHVAKILYQIMILSTCITMVCVPFAAMMNAHEDIVALSYINIGSYLIRLGAAISLYFFENNLLIIFSLIILSSIAFKLFVETIYCKLHYKELVLNPRKFINSSICKEMTEFTSWNTLGSFSVLFRDEGVAVMLNYYFGTAINAAYGIANQVNSLVLSFAGNLTTVFSPSIIQAKGAGDDEKMKRYAIFTSKISFLLSSLMALPILTFLHDILLMWLGEIPKYTETFCRLIIICFLIQMLYPGLNRMIYATGKIRNYQLGMFIAFISILPLGLLMFNKFNQAPPSIVYVMIISQIAVLNLSLLLVKKYCGLNIINFIIHGILLPILIFTLLMYISHYISVTQCFSHNTSYIICYSIILDSLYFVLFYYIILNKTEKSYIKHLFTSIRK